MSDESLAGKNLKKSLSHIPYLQQDSIYSKRKIQIFSSNPVQLGAWPRRVCEHTAQGEGEKWHVSAPPPPGNSGLSCFEVRVLP